MKEGFKPESGHESVLSDLGRMLTPIFIPMGLEKENWPATVGLFTGIFAKESIVGTLNALYSQQESKAAGMTGLVLLKKNFSPEAAYAYLLFILIYMPCIAAVSTVMKEINFIFGLLQALYLTALAWIASTLFYQIVKGHNPYFIAAAGLMAVLIFMIFRLIGRRR